MKKIISILILLTLVVSIASAGCITHEINLDTSKSPTISSTTMVGEPYNMYIYDVFVMREYVDVDDKEISYDIVFDDDVISREDWKSKTNMIVYDVEDYHDAKYPDTYSIDYIGVYQKTNGKSYATEWSPDKPDEITYWMRE